MKCLICGEEVPLPWTWRNPHVKQQHAEYAVWLKRWFILSISLEVPIFIVYLPFLLNSFNNFDWVSRDLNALVALVIGGVLYAALVLALIVVRRRKTAKFRDRWVNEAR